MGRRRKKAAGLSKWIGSLGEFGEPPVEYFIAKAAKELGMTYFEMEQHPERERLMAIAFTLSEGQAEGEFQVQLVKEFWMRHREREKKIAKVRDPVMNKK